jgi:hypothetical protein
MSDAVGSVSGASPGTAPPLVASGSSQVDGSEVVRSEGSSRVGRVSSDPVVFGVTAAIVAAILAFGQLRAAVARYRQHRQAIGADGGGAGAGRAEQELTRVATKYNLVYD